MDDVRTHSTRIDSKWWLREIESRGTSEASDLGTIPAEVPGHVHLDLMRAGVIQDPFHRMAERSAAWIDELDWEYRTTFRVREPVAPFTVLHFQGLDTVAEIRLNGEPLGTTDNMFIPHEFHVSDRLKVGDGPDGDNVLEVTFRSALKVGRERQQAWAAEGNPTLKPHWFLWGPRSFVRKAQYMYGWDWGPELVSCGIWKPVDLVQIPIARLLDHWYETTLHEDGSATVMVEAFYERAPGSADQELELTAVLVTEHDPNLPPVVPVTVEAPPGTGRKSVRVELHVLEARRWWPNGHTPSGDPTGADAAYIYSLDLLLHHGDELVDRKHANVGIRTVELVREKDAVGESFGFRVNGEMMFAKGANWIPADSFPARLHVDPEHWPTADHPLEQLVQDAAAAGFNMLRVWGGGFYESEHFYDLCDHYGLLVWQDFPYGCAYYPDTGKYAEAAREEAVSAVRRLRSHPSLAIWCGNNENDTMHRDGWSGADNRPTRYLGEKLYHDILPAVIQTEDGARPYWPSSPYGGDDPNSQGSGDRHDWDVWHGRGDWVYYREDDSRFVSEFGFASSCGLAAWNRCLDAEDRWPRSSAVRWHDKTRKGYETYLGFIDLHFPQVSTLDDLVYFSQLNQAEALKCAIEHWRRRKGHCWGVLFWQLNDCWPVQSWSVVDYLGKLKAGYHAVRRAFAPALISFVKREDQVEIHLTNDTLNPVKGELQLSIATFDGETLFQQSTAASMERNATGIVGKLDLGCARGREREVYVDAQLLLDDPGSRSSAEQAQVAENILFLAEPKDLRLSDPGLHVEVEEFDHECCLVRVGAKRLAAYVWLNISGSPVRRGMSWGNNFFHVRPGTEVVTIFMKTDAVRSASTLRGLIELRSL